MTAAKSERSQPPKANQFIKGHSGFPLGRPKGAVSTKALTRKVATKKHRVKIDGRVEFRTLLELVILKANSMAMSGHAGAADLMDSLRERLQPEPKKGGGFLIVPTYTEAEKEAAYKDWNERHPFEPGSKEQEEFEAEYYKQTIVDPQCPLGIAIDEHEAKWRHSVAHSNYMTVTNKFIGTVDKMVPAAEYYAEEVKLYEKKRSI